MKNVLGFTKIKERLSLMTYSVGKKQKQIDHLIQFSQCISLKI